MEKGLVLKNVEHSFGKGAQIAAEDLRLPSGASAVILGRSGSGKTTTLRILSFLLKPHKGTVLFNGISFWDSPPWMRKKLRLKVGLVQQEGGLIDYLSVKENVELPLLVLKIKPKERLGMIENALRTVDLEPARVMGLLPSQLSGGMKRRVSVARALVTGCEWLLFDEPTAGLDPVTEGKLIETLHKLKETERKSFVFSTHDPWLAREMGELFCMVKNGVISKTTPKEELETTESGKEVLRFLSLRGEKE